MELSKECEKDIREFLIANIDAFKADCIAYDCYAPDDDERNGLQITIGTDGDSFSYQTGDNSFTGGAYGFPIWGVACIAPDTDGANLADWIIKELQEEIANG